MFALPIFPGSHPPSIVSVHVLNFCVRDGERGKRRLWRMKRPERVAAVGKKQACFDKRCFCRAPQQETGGPVHLSKGMKKASTLRSRLVFALPIFPGSHPPSIVSVHVLNFCVRDGNRWTHMTINTNSFSVACYHLYIQSPCGL